MFLAYFANKKAPPFPFTLRSHNLNINPNPYLGYANASQTTRGSAKASQTTSPRNYKWLPPDSLTRCLVVWRSKGSHNRLPPCSLLNTQSLLSKRYPTNEQSLFLTIWRILRQVFLTFQKLLIKHQILCLARSATNNAKQDNKLLIKILNTHITPLLHHIRDLLKNRAG